MDLEQEYQIEKLFDSSGARYYFEVMFHSKRTVEKSTCFVQIYAKGGEDYIELDKEKLNVPEGQSIPDRIPLPEGGAIKMYWCPFCDAIILPLWHFGDIVICQACQSKPGHKELGGEKFFNCSAGLLADALAKEFPKVKHHADLLIKYHERDIRYDPKNSYVFVRNHLDQVYEGRTFCFYSMDAIVKDSVNHNSLTTALKNALTA